MYFSAITLLTGLFISSFITSCSKVNKAGATKDSVGVVEVAMKNVSYGSDTGQRMDVYLPANRAADETPILLFIHGGGWSSGDKNDFNDGISAIHVRLPAWAIFNMNYRLAHNSRNRYPAQMQDVEAVVKFIENKAGEYKVNSNKICLIGASAGAHLALLKAYKYNPDGKVKAVVDLFGPTDLANLYNNHPVPQQAKALLMNLMAKSPKNDLELYKQASPINFITSKSVPTLIFHGIDDMVVPITQSNELKAKLLANGVKVEMTAYPAEGHGWYGKNLQDTYDKTVRFIKENVN